MKKRNRALWFAIAILAASNIFQMVWNSSLFYFDAVPDEETAKKITEVVLKSMYGEDYFALGGLYTTMETSFDAIRRAWIVREVFPEFPEGYLVLGTVLEVVIRMKDAKIMSISHR